MAKIATYTYFKCWNSDFKKVMYFVHGTFIDTSSLIRMFEGEVLQCNLEFHDKINYVNAITKFSNCNFNLCGIPILQKLLKENRHEFMIW